MSRLSSCLRSVNFSIRKSFPSDIKQVEGKKTRLAAMKEQVIKLRSSAPVNANNLTIEHSSACTGHG
jgi:DNA transposition AAA+ family ATPase